MKIFNRKVKRDYHILETFETGIVLTGAEVKSIRAGRVNIDEAFARVENNQLVLKNVYIYPYLGQTQINPRRDRKLLMHKGQINSLIGKISKSAVTLIPLSLYTTRNLIKVELSLAGSKKKYDHRRAIKAKDEQRKIEQELS